MAFRTSPFRVKEIATAATAYEVEANVDAPPTAADGGVTQIVAAARLPLKLVHLFAEGSNALVLPMPLESDLLGGGAYSKVYRINFKGTLVAAKVFNTYAGRGGCLHEVGCAVATWPSKYIVRLIDVA